ncbi:hypothetical protein HMPREF0262_03121 [Clostridium sp. ATCC 29733]|nr:hypothetical protein HMPREF0262_03121 [Clostridium sp. ATCC 29733]
MIRSAPFPKSAARTEQDPPPRCKLPAQRRGNGAIGPSLL